MASYAVSKIGRAADIISSVRVMLEGFLLMVVSEIIIRVRGRANCKRPVRGSGIFPVAQENIITGGTDTTPANQMSRVDAEVSWSGCNTLKSNNHMASVRLVVKNKLSIRVPLRASSGLAFFMYV